MVGTSSCCYVSGLSGLLSTTPSVAGGTVVVSFVKRTAPMGFRKEEEEDQEWVRRIKSGSKEKQADSQQKLGENYTREKNKQQQQEKRV